MCLSSTDYRTVQGPVLSAHSSDFNFTPGPAEPVETLVVS